GDQPRKAAPNKHRNKSLTPIFRQRRVTAYDAHAVTRVGGRILLLNAIGNGRQLGSRLLQRHARFETTYRSQPMDTAVLHLVGQSTDRHPNFGLIAVW